MHIRFSTLRNFHESGIKTEGGGRRALHILNWDRAKSHDKNTAKNLGNFYDAEKRIVYKLSKISIRNLISQCRDVNQNCMNI